MTVAAILAACGGDDGGTGTGAASVDSGVTRFSGEWRIDASFCTGPVCDPSAWPAVVTSATIVDNGLTTSITWRAAGFERTDFGSSGNECWSFTSGDHQSNGTLCYGRSFNNSDAINGDVSDNGNGWQVQLTR